MAERVHIRDRVLDLGCGAGHLAQMLSAKGVLAYLGVDFSAEALAVARGRCPKWFLFENMELPQCIPAELGFEPTVVIFCQVLEHLPDPKDKDCLEALPRGKRVLLSLDIVDDLTQKRVFGDAHEVHERYGKLLEIKEMARIRVSGDARWWVLSAERR